MPRSFCSWGHERSFTDISVKPTSRVVSLVLQYCSQLTSHPAHHQPFPTHSRDFRSHCSDFPSTFLLREYWSCVDVFARTFFFFFGAWSSNSGSCVALSAVFSAFTLSHSACPRTICSWTICSAWGLAISLRRYHLRLPSSHFEFSDVSHDSKAAVPNRKWSTIVWRHNLCASAQISSPKKR